MLIGASIPLVDRVDVAPATGGLFAFGFRISLLLRFCPLAMIGLVDFNEATLDVGRLRRPRAAELAISPEP